MLGFVAHPQHCQAITKLTVAVRIGPIGKTSKTMLVNFICTSIIFAVVYKTVSNFVSKKFRALLTAMDDLSLLGIPRKDGRRISGTVVVCGGR